MFKTVCTVVYASGGRSSACTSATVLLPRFQITCMILSSSLVNPLFAELPPTRPPIFLGLYPHLVRLSTKVLGHAAAIRIPIDPPPVPVLQSPCPRISPSTNRSIVAEFSLPM